MKRPIPTCRISQEIALLNGADLLPLPLNRRRWLQGAVGWLASGSLLSLTGCGSAETTSQTYLRVVNATQDFSTATVLVDGSKAIASLADGGTTSSYLEVSSGSHTVALNATSGTSGPSAAYSFTSGTYSSLVAYGSLASGMAFVHLEESSSMPASGHFKVRLLHADKALDGLDLYISNESSLSDLSPLGTVDACGDLSSFVSVSSGSYRLRITAKDDHSTVLFDSGTSSLVGFSSKLVVTLAVVPRSSGSLPDITALPEQESAGVLSNALVS